nr:hypothetical protein [Tanacetum cinerariifolium]
MIEDLVTEASLLGDKNKPSKLLKEGEAESVNLESKDLTPVFFPAEVDSNESKGLEVDSEESETKDVSCDLDENEDNGLFTTENGLVIKDSVEKDSTNAPDFPVSAEAQETKSSNSVDQNVDQLEGDESPRFYRRNGRPISLTITSVGNYRF